MTAGAPASTHSTHSCVRPTRTQVGIHTDGACYAYSLGDETNSHKGKHPQTRQEPDMTNLQTSIDDPNRFADTWCGIAVDDVTEVLLPDAAGDGEWWTIEPGSLLIADNTFTFDTSSAYVGGPLSSLLAVKARRYG